jgi:hypothetical protein
MYAVKISAATINNAVCQGGRVPRPWDPLDSGSRSLPLSGRRCMATYVYPVVLTCIPQLAIRRIAGVYELP